MIRMLSLAMLVSVVALMPGCDTAVPPDNRPFVRIANADAASAMLDICIEGQAVLRTTALGSATEYAAVTPGIKGIAQVAPDSDCANGIAIPGLSEIQFSEATRNTIVLMPDEVPSYRLADDGSPTSAGRARVRVINASEGSQSVTVWEEGGAGLFEQVRYNRTEDYSYSELPAGTYDVSVTAQVDERVTVSLTAVVFEAGSSYTIFAAGPADGDVINFNVSINRDAAVGTSN